MTMDAQTIFNVLLGLVAFLGGYVINSIKASIDGLQSKVQAIEVLVAGSYVKRDDIDKLTAALFAKLDKIESKLDGKADR